MFFHVYKLKSSLHERINIFIKIFLWYLVTDFFLLINWSYEDCSNLTSNCTVRHFLRVIDNRNYEKLLKSNLQVDCNSFYSLYPVLILGLWKHLIVISDWLQLHVCTTGSRLHSTHRLPAWAIHHNLSEAEAVVQLPLDLGLLRIDNFVNILKITSNSDKSIYRVFQCSW